MASVRVSPKLCKLKTTSLVAEHPKSGTVNPLIEASIPPTAPQAKLLFTTPGLRVSNVLSILKDCPWVKLSIHPSLV